MFQFRPSQNNQAIYQTFRRLWYEHIFWTRLLILSAIYDLPDLEAVTERLLRNPTDFGKELQQFYGAGVGRTLALMVRDHLVLASELLKAILAGDEAQAAEMKRKWYDNAEEISAFMNRINPNWNLSDWKFMWQEHLRMVEAEAEQILQQDHAASIDTFDTMEKQTQHMAELMAEGLIRQFRL
ncbi:MAG: acetylglutamate kinase [Eubacteriales bacterium]